MVIAERKAWINGCTGGVVSPRDKRFAPSYSAFRCVKSPVTWDTRRKLPTKCPGTGIEVHWLTVLDTAVTKM